MTKTQILTSKFGLIVLGVVFVFTANTEFKQWQQRKEIQKEIDSLQQQASSLEQKNKDLESSLAFLNSTDYKERIARQQLNLKKDGEIVINFPENGALVPTLKQEDGKAKMKNNAAGWWYYFFKNN